jgi:hypothetical protein
MQKQMQEAVRLIKFMLEVQYVYIQQLRVATMPNKLFKRIHCATEKYVQCLWHFSHIFSVRTMARLT